jgi:S-adenosylmethionine hydrolase
MRHPIITLTTDFGLEDHFVGAMKGVILSIQPRARIVDISHQIAPYGIPEAAFVLAQACRFFPPGTVHVAVVDPGVGGSRRPILAEAAGQYFVAPDNGVLSMVYAQQKHKVRAITAGRFFLEPVSRTFHGRDIFAPVAAHLSAGVAPSRFGKLIADYTQGGFGKPVSMGSRAWKGQILKIDRFGNLITNFPAAQFPQIETRRFEMLAGRCCITHYAQSYAEGVVGEVFLVTGSSGYLEIAANQGSAAKVTGCPAGAAVKLTFFKRTAPGQSRH